MSSSRILTKPSIISSSSTASYPVSLTQFPKVSNAPIPASVKMSALAVADLETLIENYLYDCELRLQSPRTLETRRVFLKNFLWFLNHRRYETCGAAEIRQFLRYLMHGHEEPGGRFGNSNLRRAARPVTVLDYYVCLRSLFDWMLSQHLITETPFSFIAKPVARGESKAPLSAEQIAALFGAVECSVDPLRNRAILALLLDTGCRASEFATIRVRDLDLINGRCRVLGKGDKYRTLFFGQKTADILKEYFQAFDNSRKMNPVQTDPNAPLFAAARGSEPLTRSGLLHLIKRLGRTAGIKDEVSVHALRRSFAVQMLRNGSTLR